MKKLTVCILILISSGLSAQKYVPFPTGNAQWNMYYKETDAWLSYGVIKSVILNYVLQGDTLTDTKTYKKLYLRTVTSGSTEMKLKGLIREENKRVYLINLTTEGYMSQVKQVSSDGKSGMSQFYNYKSGVEYLLYDFNKNQPGDTLSLLEGKIIAIDSVLIQNSYRKRYRIDSYKDEYVIEGIGSVNGGLLGPVTPLLTSMYNYEWEFVSYSQNDECIYKNPVYVDCNSAQKWTDALTTPMQSNHITVSPNPVTESSTIRWDISENNLYTTLVITDVLGKSIKTVNVSGKTEISISRSDFKKGIYIAKLVKDRGLETTAKIIVQ
jgi:hypothetical protein